MSIVFATVSSLLAIVLGAAPTIWPQIQTPGRARSIYLVSLGAWVLVTIVGGGVAYAEAQANERRMQELTEALREALRVRGGASSGIGGNLMGFDLGAGIPLLGLGVIGAGLVASRAQRYFGLALALLWALICVFYIAVIAG